VRINQLQGRVMNVLRNAVLGFAAVFCLAGCASDFDKCVEAEADAAKKKMADELGDDLALQLLRLRIFHHQEEALLMRLSMYSEILQSDRVLRETLEVASVNEAVRASEFRGWTEIMVEAGVTPQSWGDVEAYREGMAESFERLVLPWTKIKLTSAEVRENSDRRLKALEQAESAYYAQIDQIAIEASRLAQEACEPKR
jgi:hypothetical protein